MLRYLLSLAVGLFSTGLSATSHQPACVTSLGEIEGIDDTPKKRFHPSLVEFLGVILIN